MLWMVLSLLFTTAAAKGMYYPCKAAVVPRHQVAMNTTAKESGCHKNLQDWRWSAPGGSCCSHNPFLHSLSSARLAQTHGCDCKAVGLAMATAGFQACSAALALKARKAPPVPCSTCHDGEGIPCWFDIENSQHGPPGAVGRSVQSRARQRAPAPGLVLRWRHRLPGALVGWGPGALARPRLKVAPLWRRRSRQFRQAYAVAYADPAIAACIAWAAAAAAATTTDASADLPSCSPDWREVEHTQPPFCPGICQTQTPHPPLQVLYGVLQVRWSPGPGTAQSAPPVWRVAYALPASVHAAGLRSPAGGAQ